MCKTFAWGHTERMRPICPAFPGVFSTHRVFPARLVR